MIQEPKLIMLDLIALSVCETVAEFIQHWYSEEQKAQHFEDLFRAELGGWLGIATFHIEICVYLEQTVFNAGGWKEITTVFDELIGSVITFIFNAMSSSANTDTLKRRTEDYIQQLIKKEIE